MTFRKTTAALLFVALAGSSSLGCKSIAKKMAEKAAQKAVEAATKGAEAAESATLPDSQLDAALECSNHAGMDTKEALMTYLNRLDDPKKGPTMSDHPYLNVPPEVHYTNCEKGLKAASSDDKVLTDSINAWKASLAAVKPVMGEMSKYLSRDEYKDDKMAKGMEIHKRLMPLAEAYFAAFHTMDAEITKRNDDRQAKELEAVLAKEGRSTHYLQLAGMAAAKKAINTSTDDAFDDPKKVPAEAFTRLDTETTALTKAVEELEAAPKGKDEGPFHKFPIDKLVDFMKAEKEMVRRIRDKKSYSSTEMNWRATGSGWMVEGCPEKALKKYNELIEASNR